ncbi:MAG TPA: DHH family phosphoesterase, partial [Roseimicrobium sp.]|nr:DHH family phosphoesterase [Roseimicrobium sp.]
MKHRWNISTPDPAAVALLQRSLGVSPLLSQCLVNRGLSDPAIAERFLKPRLKDLGDPFELPDMDKAVARLWMARTNGESVVIFGDYDVDGVSSTAILLEAFESLGWKCQGYLPRRLEEGYGLSRDGVENCLKKHPTTLLLAVDCGSTATETIGWLNSQGVDVLVLDHHQLSDPAPAAVALVNPHRGVAGAAPNRELCSAGLSFKLVHALVKRGREEGVEAFKSFDIRTLLDLVALATIADLVPLTGENRALVSAGLERLSTTRRPGLVALKSVAGVKGTVTGFEVGYQLGPRLNASGRLENAEASLHLLRA